MSFPRPVSFHSLHPQPRPSHGCYYLAAAASHSSALIHLNQADLVDALYPLSPHHLLPPLEYLQLLLNEGDSPFASRPKELDQWFQQVYDYYNEKGLACLVTNQVLNIATVAFTWCFSGFVLLCIDWSQLWTCSDCMALDEVGGCRDVCVGMVTWPRGGTVYVMICASYLLVLLAYLVHRILFFAKDIKSLISMQRFFNQVLGIPDTDLTSIEWCVVSHRLIELQRRYPNKFIRHHHDEHDIVSRIMRKDNYMIALLDGPLQGALNIEHPLVAKLMGPRALTLTMEWCIRHCVVERLFDCEYKVDPRFLASPHMLQQRFYVAGIVNLVLSPFIIVFLLIYFALKNAQRFHADPRSLSTRSWSLEAKYTFRKFNELSHYFQVCLPPVNRFSLPTLSSFS